MVGGPRISLGPTDNFVGPTSMVGRPRINLGPIDNFVGPTFMVGHTYKTSGRP